MKKLLYFLSITLLFSSCSSLFYSNRDFNNTFSIESNVKNFEINFPYLRHESYQVNNGNFTHTLPNLGRKYTTFDIRSNDYETQRINLKKSIRTVPLLLDILYLPATFGIPLVIDLLKSDFYKISSASKNSKITLVNTQSFMLGKFDKIRDSKNSEVLNRFVKDYPSFNKIDMVINLRDSLEFNLAIESNKEQNITNFIKSRPTSKYLSKATKIESEFTKTRIEFSNVKLKNTVEAFGSFINNFPNAIQISEAHRLLVEAAERDALKSFTSTKKIIFFNDYLIPNKKYLSNIDFSNKKALIISTILKAIEIEIANKDLIVVKSNYSNYNLLNKNNIDLSDLNKFSEIFQSQIANPLFSELLKIRTNQEQLAFENKVRNDFPNLFNNSNIVVNILTRSVDKNGRVVIFNADYLSSDFFDPSLSKKYKNSPSSTFKYKGNSILTFENPVKQILTFSQNVLSAVQENYLKGGLISKLNIDDLKIINEEYFFNNSLVGHNFYDSNGSYLYTYEYENGVNLSLKKFDDDLKVYNKLVSNNSLDQALEGYRQLLNNKYPQEISQNIELKNKIEICRQLIVKKEIEDEKIRIAEEARQEKIRLAEEAREERMRIAEEARQEKIRIAEERQKAKEAAQEFNRLMILLGKLNQVKEKLDNPYGVSSTNRQASPYSSKSSSGKRACSACKGTGNCPKCSRTQEVYGFANGGDRVVKHNESRNGRVVCPQCHGNMRNWGHDKNKSCYLCKAAGWINCEECNASGNGRNIGKCKRCGGTGQY
ncbi:hypothetical protein PQG44_05630 [Aquirufa sp. LEPPI-3A]|uniref:hypothetical protein n=1 Tax=Aquirufa regiilacus TaxID=3024868 RepID=UPI0028DF3975|nr:hypothetical protein [Aquirufa sp. LEPPI-3A]MDT8887145.1 hypothetical protein [Aquirufa sp. LEPPI-3A]